MKSDQGKRVDELFHLVSQASSLTAERELLRKHGADDPPEVIERVVSLLKAHRATGSFQLRPLPLMEGIKRIGEAADPMIGRHIGPYEIKRKLGSGGFGTVYMALRTEPYQKKVAIKLLRTDYLEEPEVVARFWREGEVLADLDDHKNICNLLDAGRTTEGRPYFILEYVDGKPITTNCNEKKLSLRERVRLYQDLCRAVAHAHKFDVIHRDIKPDNIIVTEEGVPKLLDFGIAKIIDPRSRKRMVTLSRFGQPCTPEYASPEQISDDEVSKATDIYSLGVVLYLLLTGKRPYEFENNSMAEMERVICHVEPKKPSAAVDSPSYPSGSTDRQNNAADSESSQRKTTKKLRSELEDLDGTVLCAMAKDTQDRYKSVDLLVEDLQRFLEGRPPKGRGTPLKKRFLKWLRREPWKATAIGMVVFVFAVVGLIISNWPGDDSGQMPLRPSDAQAVTVSTNPAGATVVIVPLDELNLAIENQDAIRPKGKTPVVLHLRPGNYRVDAMIEGRGSHRVYRRVGEPGVRSVFSENHRSWTVTEQGLDWPVIKILRKDEVTQGMVYIEGGVFSMGGGTAGPKHPHSVDNFFIDRTEVTIAEYESAGYATPFGRPSELNGLPARQPVTFVNYHQALAYAEATGKQLMREDQYEYVATNRGATRFPHGPNDRSPWGTNDQNSISWPYGVVGVPAFDRTKDGVLGLFSNVAELTDSAQLPYPGSNSRLPRAELIAVLRHSCVIRGGNHDVAIGKPKPSLLTEGPRVRESELKDQGSRGLGFRCVYVPLSALSQTGKADRGQPKR